MTHRTYGAEQDAADLLLESMRRGVDLGAEAAEIATKAANGHFTEETFATRLANEHPTLLARTAKVVGVAVMRRVTRNPMWNPGDPTVGEDGAARYCDKPNGTLIHPDHDGRFDCDTVVGALLASRQRYI